MARNTINYNPGPSAVPAEVLQIVQKELLDYQGTGISILESSHRAAEYDAINNEAMALVRELFGLGADYHVLFMTGGASSQFALIPMNFLRPGEVGAYVDTGTWSTKAIQECRLLGEAHIAFSSREEDFRRVPAPEEIRFPANAAYLHFTSNNTIKGTQSHQFPDTGPVPLICDMSSDIASRQLDFTRFSLIYAGAQKNLGPSGVTLVIIHDGLLSRCKDGLPTMFTYKTHAEKKSLYNTPPVFGVYFLKLVLEWLKEKGGLAAMEEINRRKKDLLYNLIDAHPDFYRGTAEKESRSWMNVTLRLPDGEMEKKFIAAARDNGIIGVKGHRSVGGIRFSLYNAVTVADVEQTADFMEAFRKGTV